jgi:hypothetical protein
MSPIRTAATVIGVAMTVARHPMVRAAVRAAPHIVTPQVREKAKDATLDAAFRAGQLARKLVKRD